MTTYATFERDELKAGNALLERRWKLVNGRLHAVSLLDKRTGREWILAPSTQPSFVLGAAGEDFSFSTRTGRDLPVESEGLIAELSCASHTIRFRVFENSAAVTVQYIATETLAEVSVSKEAAGELPSGAEDADRAKRKIEQQVDIIEQFLVRWQGLRFTAVTLRAQTDHHNQLVFEHEYLLHANEQRIAHSGNVAFLEDLFSSEGLIFIKQAPLPSERPAKYDADVCIASGGVVSTFGHGLDASGGAGYATAIIPYEGGRIGRISALHQYQRCFREFVPGRDGLLLSNTWGDRSKDGAVNEPFMRKEIAAGAKLGVDVIQIDDGWESGRTANSVQKGGVWQGYWAQPNFWEIDKTRFPNGLIPLIDEARKHGMQFGLWYGPDSIDQFKNWEKDAAQILKLHRELGVNYFKLDSMLVTTKQSERNLARFVETVLKESDGKVTFDLDVTAQVRHGYFGLIGAGPIFVENRYTDWHGYYPHATLRNLWQLAHYVDPVRLRMEFLNNARNIQKYGDDPLAPARYSPATLFASVMFSSPLGWFEISNLPREYIKEASEVVKAWKVHREAIFQSDIIPIGNAPDGVSWTGFAALAKDRRSAHILLFREHSKESEFSLEPLLKPDLKYRAATVIGHGATSLRDRALSFSVREPLGFIWSHITPAESGGKKKYRPQPIA
ncbi:MAG TPA: alpha-galactosidase [Planctomycetota bacterium]|nr:alpha-galactosidase [Planctomycetota bacterium]